MTAALPQVGGPEPLTPLEGLPASLRLRFEALLHLRSPAEAWPVYRAIFPDAPLLLWLIPAGENLLAVHAATGALAALEPLPLTPAHPLARALEQGSFARWERSTETEPPFPWTRSLEQRGRTHRLLPIEALLIPLGAGAALVRLAYEPGHRSTPEDRLLGQLLAAHVPAQPGAPTLPGPWLGELAQQLVGVRETTSVIQAALATLTAHFPGLEVLLYEIDISSTRARKLGGTLEADGGEASPNWIALPPRFADALTANRPFRIADRPEVPWLTAAAAQFEVPEGEVLTLWPIRHEDTNSWLLFLGHPPTLAADTLAATLEEWVPLVHRGRASAERLETLAEESGYRLQEVTIAATIQRSLLPQNLAAEDWQIEVYHETDQGLAGDFVLRDDLPEGWRLAVGDVAGRGIPASLTMMAAYSLLQAQWSRGGGLEAVMARWSADLQRLSERNQERGGDLSYTTAVLLTIDRESGAVQFGKAGHPYPLHYEAASETVARWDAMGYPAGLFEDQTFETGPRQLDPGDALVLYTDGFSEAGTGDGQFGIDRMSELTQSFGRYPAIVLRDRLLLALEQHLHGQSVGDDTTLVVVTRAQHPWEHRQGVPTAQLADTWLPWRLEPEATDTRLAARQDLAQGLRALADGLGRLVPSPPATGWSIRWSAGASVWLGAIQIPDLTRLLPDAGRPSQCMAALETGDHPLRGLSKKVDFCWVAAESNELVFARRW